MWWLLACQPKGEGTVPDDGVDSIAPPDHTGAPVDHTGALTVPSTPPTLTDVSARLHEEFGTVGVVSWTQDVTASVHVEFEVDGRTLSSPTRELAAGAHEELILGVPYTADVTWHLVATNAAGDADTAPAALRTTDRPADMPVATAVSGAGHDPAIPYVLLSMNRDGGSFGSRWWTMIVDRDGRVVWARESEPSRINMHPRLNWTGDALLVDQNSYWATFDGGASSRVQELTLDGTVLHEYLTPGLHHPHTPLPDGSLAYGAVDRDDEALAIVRRDGSSTELFRCQAWLASLGDREDCGSNTLNYDEASDSFVFSFFTFETVVRIDGTTGEPLEWYGHATDSWAFDPPSSAFWYQHGGHLRADGAFVTSTYDARSPDELVVRVYERDAGARTLRQLEVYGEGEGVYGDQMGEVSETPGGHVLHNYGTLPRVREFDASGAVVWDIEWSNPGHDIGRTTPIPDLYGLAGPRR